MQRRENDLIDHVSELAVDLVSISNDNTFNDPMWNVNRLDDTMCGTC